MSETTSKSGDTHGLREQSQSTPQTLDDVMMAMDVVDTLRHRALIVEKELGADAREEDMIQRLREIYDGQGIEVPDHILRDGVKALEENRFVYEPPKDSFSIKLAKAYVNRNRWLRPLLIVVGFAALVTGIYRFGIVGPKNAAFNAAKTELSKTYKDALAAAQTDYARNLIASLHNQGEDAIETLQRKKLSTIVTTLKQVKTTLDQPLTIRIVSRPGELSGVFRVPDNAPGTRNYYIIVEAIDATGKAVALEIASEEDQKTARVSQWGVRVSEAAFDGVKADKQDDQIIQNADIGEKPRGALQPTYAIKTAGGAILDW